MRCGQVLLKVYEEDDEVCVCVRAPLKVCEEEEDEDDDDDEEESGSTFRVSTPMVLSDAEKNRKQQGGRMEGRKEGRKAACPGRTDVFGSL